MMNETSRFKDGSLRMESLRSRGTTSFWRFRSVRKSTVLMGSTSIEPDPQSGTRIILLGSDGVNECGCNNNDRSEYIRARQVSLNGKRGLSLHAR